MPVVDIADAAAAHTLAMLSPHASGRYLLCERTTYVTDIAAILRWARSARSMHAMRVNICRRRHRPSAQDQSSAGPSCYAGAIFALFALPARRHAFPGYWIPSVRAPYWFMVGLALFTGFINIKYLRAAYER